MRFARALAAVAVLATFAAPIPGRAFDGPGCGTGKAPLGKTYTLTATCGPFAWRGLPTLVQGDSTGSGPASVDVKLFVWGYPNLPPILECSWSVTSGGYSHCDKGLIDETNGFTIPDQYGTVSLGCTVTGSGTGTFYCQTGCGETVCSTIP
ncbi:MAG: hypothetical protein ABR552_07480 [Actinomycetota bacterium]